MGQKHHHILLVSLASSQNFLSPFFLLMSLPTLSIQVLATAHESVRLGICGHYSFSKPLPVILSGVEGAVQSPVTTRNVLEIFVKLSLSMRVECQHIAQSQIQVFCLGHLIVRLLVQAGKEEAIQLEEGPWTCLGSFFT